MPSLQLVERTRESEEKPTAKFGCVYTSVPAFAIYIYPIRGKGINSSSSDEAIQKESFYSMRACLPEDRFLYQIL